MKLECARSERQKQSLREEYNARSKEVKQGAREAKRIWLEKRVAAAEKAAENDKCRELYNTT